MPRPRRLAVAVTLVVAGIAGMLVGLAPPASAAGTLTSLGWSVSSTASGATGVSYTYTFTPASAAIVQTVTMTVPAGTGGFPAVGTVTPASLAAGDSVSLASGALTFTSTTSTSISSSNPVSIKITGLTNTSTAGSYTSLVSTKVTGGTLVDSGTTPAVTTAGTLTSPPAAEWRFSEGSGTTTADSSGNGHTGTLGTGIASTGMGWAAPVVGTHSIATTCLCTAGAVTVTGPVVNTAGSYTVSAWVYLTAVTAAAQTFVSITGTPSPGGSTISGFFLQYVGNGSGVKNFGFAMRPSDATGSIPVAQVRSAANSVVLNTWYHIVGVYNMATIALYVNGTLAASGPYSGAWQATGNTMIGQAWYGAASDKTTARIDDVAMYSSALTPAQVAALNQPVISSGYSHTCEITSGNAYCWGLNGSGELGNNSTVNSSVPVPVLTGGLSAIATGTTLTQISASDNSTCALDSTGAAYCWGGGSSGQLGNNSSTSVQRVPVAVTMAGLTFTQISAGHSTACAVASTGTAYCWGLDTYGELGNGGTNSSVPKAVSNVTTFTDITVGKFFACGVTSAGNVYCWGDNVYGQLGNNSTCTPTPDCTGSSVPVEVLNGSLSALAGLTQVSAGAFSACALDNTGAAYCWGHGTNGQLGNGPTNPTAQTTAAAVDQSGVPGGTLTQVSTGNQFTCALNSTGAAYCWGIGTNGDLGNNSTANTSVPGPVSPSGVLSGVTLTQVSPGGPGGGATACALDTSGTAYCWGLNSFGQAGNPDTAVSSPVPVTVQLSQPTTVAAGNIHSCEIRSGLAYCWGDNSNGELGNSSTMNSSVPVAVWTGGVLSGVTLTEITTGTNFSCALSAAGAAYCWGLGTSGQLGNNLGTSSSLPVAVYTGGALAGLTLTQITASGATACALASTGAAYCWGADDSGQLGSGGTCPCANSNLPVAVTTAGTPLSGLILTGINSGGTSTCALDSTGAAYCWGLGTSGQLGNNAILSSSTAVAVRDTPGVLAGIATGSNFACALASTGVAYCWGDNTYGELGIGSLSPTTSAVPLAVLSGATLTQLQVGSNSSCALSSAGLGYCWGDDTHGELGNKSTTTPVSAPVAVYTGGVLTVGGVVIPLVQIIVGTTFACTLSNTGAAYCWGANASGQLGNPATAASATTFDVPAAVTSEPTMIATGYQHSCLLRNGKGYCWGDDTYGALGNNTTSTPPVSTPVAVYTAGVLTVGGVVTPLIQIVTANSFTCALGSNGNAYCWGAGGNGQLGNSTGACPCASSNGAPVLVQGGHTFTQISVGTNFACALTSAGTAYCWGADDFGEIGNIASASQQPVPLQVSLGAMPAGTVLTQISAGYEYACALASTGAAYCWGDDTHGELGNGITSGTPQTTAAAVSLGAMPTGTVLTQIAVTIWTLGGLESTCALSAAGADYCWGDDTDSELGNGTTSTTPQNTPVAVSLGVMPAGTVLAQVTVGDNFACALDSTGAAYCWGLGTGGIGQLGNNQNTVSSTTPVAVYTAGVLTVAGAVTSLFQISSDQATCTQDTTGAFYCWGLGTSGQLGNAATTSSDVPVTVTHIVPGAPTAVSATAGDATATISWTAPANLGTGTLTGYTATATAASGTFTCTTTSAVTCVISGLTDGIIYSVTVVTLTTDGNSLPSSPAVNVEPIGFLQLTSPTSLTWGVTGTGADQSTVDGISGDQQLTVTDNTVTGHGWHITVSATTFTTGPRSLPDAAAVHFTGSVLSVLATTAPTATCVGTCTLPTDNTTYPVAITTATSPATYTVYDTAASTGEGVMTIGGSSAPNPIGWWVQVPASAYAGVYTSTVTLAVVSAP